MTVDYRKRQPNESLLAFRGRIRREAADAVDALKLQPGEPIFFAGKFTRFDPNRHKRSERNYGSIRRLIQNDELKEFNRLEKEKRDTAKRQQEWQAKQEAFRARPEVRAAELVRGELEWNLERALAKLTPEEWIALAARIEHKEGK
jgi:hypothetical protein